MVDRMKPLFGWISAILVITVGLVGIAKPQWLDRLNLMILTVTLLVLVYYAMDTHRIADQTAENALRPVVLRSGFLTWEDVRQLLETQEPKKPIQFTILKNIATDIQGYVVFNRRKHALLFGGDISEIPLNVEVRLTSPNAVARRYVPQWTWTKPDVMLFAVAEPDSDSSDEENSLFIQYRDISGNPYYTEEDKDFRQECGRL